MENSKNRKMQSKNNTSAGFILNDVKVKSRYPISDNWVLIVLSWTFVCLSTMSIIFS